MAKSAKAKKEKVADFSARNSPYFYLHPNALNGLGSLTESQIETR